MHTQKVSDIRSVTHATYDVKTPYAYVPLVKINNFSIFRQVSIGHKIKTKLKMGCVIKYSLVQTKNKLDRLDTETYQMVP